MFHVLPVVDLSHAYVSTMVNPWTVKNAAGAAPPGGQWETFLRYFLAWVTRLFNPGAVAAGVHATSVR